MCGPPFWPRPPARPRYIHEATLRRPADIAGDSAPTGLMRELVGVAALEQTVFEKPAAVVARHGRIYVADSVRRRIIVFDVPRRRVFGFGLRTPGRLVKPAGLALDAASNAYVADSTARCVQVYDGWGLLLATIGGPRQLERPTGVAVDAAGTRIYVIDRASNDSDAHRVRIYSRDGALLGDLGWSESQAPEAVVDGLAQYYAAAEEVFARHPPVRSKFAADEIMAVSASRAAAAVPSSAARDIVVKGKAAPLAVHVLAGGAN